MGVTGSFRGKLFGGFDRKDVSDYITALAAERNELKKKCECLEAETESLREKLAASEELLELERIRASEYIISARADALRELESLCAKYEDIKTSTAGASAQICRELAEMCASFSDLDDTLGGTGAKLNEICASLRKENTAPVITSAEDDELPADAEDDAE